MDTIHTTLKNYSLVETINEILPRTEGYEYTTKGVIRLKTKPICSCGREMLRNGWDPLTHKNLVTIKTFYSTILGTIYL